MFEFGELTNGMFNEAAGKNDPVTKRMREHYNLSANVAGMQTIANIPSLDI